MLKSEHGTNGGRKPAVFLFGAVYKYYTKSLAWFFGRNPRQNSAFVVSITRYKRFFASAFL